MREKINLTTNRIELLAIMGEGNPEALSVLIELLKRPDAIATLLHLDDMNIRGCQIWVGYKDYCNQDIDEFVAATQRRDDDMLQMINRECLIDDFMERAVASGASYLKASGFTK